VQHYYWQGDDLLIKVLLQPNASRNAIVGMHGNHLKISLMTPPIGGKANKQLIVLLGKVFRVKKSNIAILTGERSRYKTVRICAPSHLPDVFSE